MVKVSREYLAKLINLSEESLKISDLEDTKMNALLNLIAEGKEIISKYDDQEHSKIFGKYKQQNLFGEDRSKQSNQI